MKASQILVGDIISGFKVTQAVVSFDGETITFTMEDGWVSTFGMNDFLPGARIN